MKYEIDVPMRNGGFAAFAEAEQLARDLTWSPEAVDSAETLFQVPPDQFRSCARVGGTPVAAWPGAEKVAARVFPPNAMSGSLRSAVCADLSREAAAELLRL